MEQSEYIDYSSEEEQEYQQPKTDITDVEIFYKGLKEYLESTYSSILDRLEFSKLVKFVKKQNPEEFGHI